MTDNTTDTDAGFNPVELAADLTMAWLGNSNTRANAEDVPAFLASMHKAVTELGASGAAAGNAEDNAEPEYTPAVSVRKSLGSPDFIISMIDGKAYRSLKRHLSSRGLTPDQYRQRYGLKADYPMVAPAYSEQRREVAKRLGLGRKPGQKVAPKAEAAPAKGRRTASAAKKAAQPGGQNEG